MFYAHSGSNRSRRRASRAYAPAPGKFLPSLLVPAPRGSRCTIARSRVRVMRRVIVELESASGCNVHVNVRNARNSLPPPPWTLLRPRRPREVKNVKI